MNFEDHKGGTGMDDLDMLLARARDVDVPTGLMGRVLEDALAAQPVPRAAPVSLWRRLGEALGGWQGLGGLALATCAGFWIGIAPPAYLPETAQSLLGASTAQAEYAGAFGWTLEELE
ncbi:MAG: hypothetical protein AAFY38_10525 [Pseudomonadota bacterium]